MPLNNDLTRQNQNQSGEWPREGSAHLPTVGQRDWNGWNMQASEMNMDSHYGSAQNSASSTHSHHSQSAQTSSYAQERYEPQMQQQQLDQQQQHAQWFEQAQKWNAQQYRDQQQQQFTRQHSYQAASSPSYTMYQSAQQHQQDHSLSNQHHQQQQQQHHNRHMHNQHQQAQAQQQYHSGEPWQQGDSSGQHPHGGAEEQRKADENWPNAFTDDCWSHCGSKLAPHMEVFTMLTKTEGDASGRTNFKKQNNYLMKVLFDDAGECVFHVDCVLGIFKISKGRLKRLQERIKREMRGEVARHGLYGRPSNNRKKAAGDDVGSPAMILADEDLPLAVVHDAGALSELAAGDHMSEAAADDDFDDIDYEDTGSMDVCVDVEEQDATTRRRSGTPSGKRPGSPEAEPSAKRRSSNADGESEEGSETGTDGTSVFGSSASGEAKSNSGGSDSGLGSSASGSVATVHHLKQPHHTHHGAGVKKKAGSDSDTSSGSGVIASPDLD